MFAHQRLAEFCLCSDLVFPQISGYMEVSRGRVNCYTFKETVTTTEKNGALCTEQKRTRYSAFMNALFCNCAIVWSLNYKV